MSEQPRSQISAELPLRPAERIVAAQVADKRAKIVSAKRRAAILAACFLLVGTVTLAGGLVGVTGNPWWFAVILGLVSVVVGVLMGLGT